jgi:hypothetical protein
LDQLSLFKNSDEVFNNVLRIGFLCSVFEAELIAILQAIKYFTLNLDRNEILNINQNFKIIIKTDEMSAILALKQTKNSHPIVYEIKI